jgi:hypothetical protein
LQNLLKSGAILLFLKHFDAPRQRLLGHSTILISRDATFGELLEIIREKLGWSPAMVLRLYEVNSLISELLRYKTDMKGLGSQPG